MKISPETGKYIAQVQEKLDTLEWPQTPPGLYEPCTYLLQLGGKRIRPALLLMAADMYGAGIDKYINQAVCVEVFHNFTLMHDDIMDEAPVRRGMPTVHKKWNINTGILSGDVMFVKAYELLAQGLSPDEIHKVLPIFSRTAAEVCEGQQMDMNFESRSDVSPGEYLEMIRLKTAVLLGAALKIGAVLAQAPDEQTQLLYNFGTNLGVAFQIKDDLLDAFGDTEKTGKQRGGDILADKKTLLLLLAKHRANQEQGEEFQKLESGDFSGADKVARTLELFRVTGAKDRAALEMNKYAGRAMESLKALNPVNSEVKHTLEILSDALLQREF